MIRRFLFALLPWMTLLCSCASSDPVIVRSLVATQCKIMIDPAPALPDTVQAIQETYTQGKQIDARVNLLLAGRLLRDQRIDELEAAIKGCNPE